MLNNQSSRRTAEFAETEPEGEASPDGEPTRREASRFRVDLDVTITSEHNFYAGFVENMSVGGIFIATHQHKKVGETLEFSVHLPDGGEPISGVGEVRWVRVYSETSNVPPGMGIRFREIDPESAERIERFLAEREPLFYDED